MSNLIQNRYEFVLYYEVTNGNPNGDPDAGNMPRIDPETGYGIVTDVCLKRKIRNYVQYKMEDRPGYKIYVTEGIPLNDQHATAYVQNEIPVPKNKKEEDAIRKDTDKIALLRKTMCDNFYDVRTFGAVMSTGVNCGQVLGPVQINFSRSVDPIVQQELTITRLTVTRGEDDKTTEMGRKHVIPYGLYRVEGYISAKIANHPIKGTGFSEDDLNLFWDALINMFEHDHSASRGKMSSRKLFVFKHADEFGNALSHQLFELIEANRCNEAEPARRFSDYQITVEREKVPEGVSLIEML